MRILLAIVVSAFSVSVMAGMPDYISPKDMANSCAEAVVKKLQKDKEVSSYLEDGMTINLEWWDNEKSAVDFTFNFGEDVRDGYMTGQVAVKAKKDGTCVVGKVLNTSVGD